MPTSTPSTSSPNPPNSPRLPELFGRETALFGWQAITLQVPRAWNLAAFGGDFLKGNARLTDDDGARLELLWESAKGTPDVARSIENLLKKLGADAKKNKREFSVIENPKLLSRARREHSDKAQWTTFGWSGDKEETVSHGVGAAWHCEVSGRVIVAHFLGRERESADRTRRLASEVLGSCCSHGEGGWNTWSVFDLQFEMPEEFHLASAKLQTGRLEFDFERMPNLDMLQMVSPRNWNRRSERIALRRISAASVVLEDESLENWSRRVAAHMFKAFRLGAPSETEVLGVGGLEMDGALRDFRRDVRSKIFDWVLRRKPHPPRALVWQDKSANKIFVVLCDLQVENAHVVQDVLESINASHA